MRDLAFELHGMAIYDLTCGTGAARIPILPAVFFITEARQRAKGLEVGRWTLNPTAPIDLTPDSLTAFFI